MALARRMGRDEAHGRDPPVPEGRHGRVSRAELSQSSKPSLVVAPRWSGVPFARFEAPDSPCERARGGLSRSREGRGGVCVSVAAGSAGRQGRVGRHWDVTGFRPRLRATAPMGQAWPRPSDKGGDAPQVARRDGSQSGSRVGGRLPGRACARDVRDCPRSTTRRGKGGRVAAATHRRLCAGLRPDHRSRGGRERRAQGRSNVPRARCPVASR